MRKECNFTDRVPYEIDIEKRKKKRGRRYLQKMECGQKKDRNRRKRGGRTGSVISV